ncbi:MAG: ornithine cyclodeaminase family protein [Amphritea sp.]
MSFKFISGEQVRSLLTVPDCIEVMKQAMAVTSAGQVNVPPRLYFSPFDDDSRWFGLMPGASQELKYYGAKILSEHRDNPTRGLPAIQGGVLLFDRESGEPVALIDGAAVTEIRTAAASALATDILANPSAAKCGIFGTGIQAAAHIDAINAVRPLTEIVISGREYSKTRQFAAQQSDRTGLNIRATDAPEEAAGCDIVCTVTSAKSPVLKGDWVQPGTHINLVGAYAKDTREADSALIAKSTVYVDLMESCNNEAGDILIPLAEGVIQPDHVIGEIGAVLNSELHGRLDSKQITVYKSLGIVAQDLFAGQFILDKLLNH